jgi:hypothetical protein
MSRVSRATCQQCARTQQRVCQSCASAVHCAQKCKVCLQCKGATYCGSLWPSCCGYNQYVWRTCLYWPPAAGTTGRTMVSAQPTMRHADSTVLGRASLQVWMASGLDGLTCAQRSRPAACSARSPCRDTAVCGICWGAASTRTESGSWGSHLHVGKCHPAQGARRASRVKCRWMCLALELSRCSRGCSTAGWPASSSSPLGMMKRQRWRKKRHERTPETAEPSIPHLLRRLTGDRKIAVKSRIASASLLTAHTQQQAGQQRDHDRMAFPPLSCGTLAANNPTYFGWL